MTKGSFLVKSPTFLSHLRRQQLHPMLHQLQGFIGAALGHLMGRRAAVGIQGHAQPTAAWNHSKYQKHVKHKLGTNIPSLRDYFRGCRGGFLPTNEAKTKKSQEFDIVLCRCCKICKTTSSWRWQMDRAGSLITTFKPFKHQQMSRIQCKVGDALRRAEHVYLVGPSLLCIFLGVTIANYSSIHQQVMADLMDILPFLQLVSDRKQIYTLI